MLNASQNGNTKASKYFVDKKKSKNAVAHKI